LTEMGDRRRHRRVDPIAERTDAEYDAKHQLLYPTGPIVPPPSTEFDRDRNTYIAREAEFRREKQQYEEQRDRLINSASPARYADTTPLSTNRPPALARLTTLQLNRLVAPVSRLEPHHHAQLVEPCSQVESACIQ
jgi:hypothetical protein